MKRLFTSCMILIFMMGLSPLKSQITMLRNRETINLQDWLFQKGKFNKAEKFITSDGEWQEVKIPHTYNMDAINDIGYYRGHASYRAKVNIPASMKDQRIFIRFEGVGHQAQVYVNEKHVGRHTGGYSAFCYEITNKVKVGEENLVAVKVNNRPNHKAIPVCDDLFNLYGGIYRPVQIFSTPKCNISPIHYASPGLFVEQKEVNQEVAKLELRTHISNMSDEKKGVLSYSIKDVSGKEVAYAEQALDLKDEKQLMTQVIEIKNPLLWEGRNNPYLYRVEAKLKCGALIDKVVQDFGLRTFYVDPDKGFILNNKPYRLFGVARHQEWKQYGPALEEEHHRTDMELIEEIGATALRLSHYQHSDLMYELSDQKGIVVWAEIPFVHDYTGREGGNAKQQLKELILQNYNHPSICVWGLWNEVRAYRSPDEPCVGLTKELNDLAHQLDPTRLTTSASDQGMKSNMGNISDLQAWNKYFGWYYGKYEDMGSWLDKSHKDYPERPIGISEYGIGGNIYQQDASKLERPFGEFFPEMEQSKYHEITWKILKDRPYVWGAYIWNMFDFSVAGWNRGGIRSLNHKGLVTFDRKVKKDAFYFYKANWSDEPVLYIAERRNNERKENLTTVKVYTNQSTVSLYVNGKKIKTKKLASDINIIQFENIKLEEGLNLVKVVAGNKNNHLKDEVIWKFKN